MSIVDSLCRLERAGNAASATNQKLAAACADVAATIADVIQRAGLDAGHSTYTDDSGLPFGGYIYRLSYPSRLVTWNYRDDCWENVGDPSLLAVNRHFADLVAGGMLDELAAWLEAEAGINKEREAEMASASSRLAEVAQ